MARRTQPAAAELPEHVAGVPAAPRPFALATSFFLPLPPGASLSPPVLAPSHPNQHPKDTLLCSIIPGAKKAICEAAR